MKYKEVNADKSILGKWKKLALVPLGEQVCEKSQINLNKSISHVYHKDRSSVLFSLENIFFL